MQWRKTKGLANQERHGGRARSARSSDPGIPKAGPAMPARGGRTPPRLLLPRCQTAASEPAAAGVQTGTGPPRRLTLPGEETARRLHSTVEVSRNTLRPKDPVQRGCRGTRSFWAGCTYRLGCRADLCDVVLRPQRDTGLISGVHAELHAEHQGDNWRVSLEDHSSQGTLINNVRLPRGHRLELSDGDLLTFGPEGPPGTSPSEFYFMFQQVRVKPQDFAAITIPRSREGTGPGFQPVLPPQGAPQRPLSTLSPAPKATLILNSIGSLSKLQPQPLTFSRSRGLSQSMPVPTPPGEVGITPAPPPRNRRKSAHRVLAELDDEKDTPEGAQPVHIEPRKKLHVEKTSLTPSGNRRGRPRKHPVSTPRTPPAVANGEPCAAPCCCLPQEETVRWVQCDGCDVWFHVVCVGCSIQAAMEADFRCPGCHVGIHT